MSEQEKLVGKHKIVVDASSYAQVPRSAQDLGLYDPQYAREAIGITNLGNLQVGDFKKDYTRIAVGSYWDLSRKTITTEVEEFDNNWTPLKCFYDTAVNLEHCFNDPETINPQKRATVEKVSLYCDLPANSRLANSSDGVDPGTGYFPWMAATKTGVMTPDGTFIPPLVDASTDFYDHYYETSRPFTPKEQLEKHFDGHGQISIANYKTYYNERIASSEYEAAVSLRYELNNSLPSVYGFLRIIANSELKDQEYNYASGPVTKYEQILQKLQVFYHGQDLSFDFGKITKPNTGDSSNILHTYPFETLVTLYGSIGSVDYDIARTTKVEQESKIIHKIINAPYDSTTVFNPYKQRPKGTAIDIDGLFASYFEEYTYRLTSDNKFNNQFLYNKKLQSLEKCMMNILFDSDILPIANKIDKYKNYFPFYNQIEFSTQPKAYNKDSPFSVAGFINNHNLNNVFLYHLASSMSKQRDSPSLPYKNVTIAAEGGPPGPVTEVVNPMTGEETIVEENVALETMESKVEDPNVQKFNYSAPYRFFDLNTDPVKQNLEEGAAIVVPANKPVQDTKQIIDILQLIDSYLDEEDYFGDFETNSYDVRNFIAPLKNDLDQGFFEAISTKIIGDMDGVFTKNINMPALKEKILGVYDKKSRSYRDIIEGKPAHTEDLFYSITKYIINNDGTELPIQNIFFPNSEKTKAIKYVDTQVKYSSVAKYRYEIYAHRIVFGSKYRYQWTADQNLAETFGDLDPDDLGAEGLAALAVHSTGFALPLSSQGPYPPLQLSADEDFNVVQGVNIDFGAADDGTGEVSLKNSLGGIGLDANNAQGNTSKYFYKHYAATFRVKVEPSIKLVADKIFNTPTMMIMDKPPVPPQVDIIPYRATNNKIKIWLDGLVDRYRQEPISILESDVEHFENIRKAQLSPDKKIEFGSDDPIKSFQIFRTDKHPEAYTDFNFYATVNGFAFEESILPNKKYYYTFRSIDGHGHISNPSSIYLVELVDDHGAVKPIIKTVSLYKPEITDNTIEMNKYLRISPSIRQLYFSDDPAVDSIFSSQDVKKKYKFRLTSKTSGKKIDINVSFQKKEEKVLVSPEKLPAEPLQAAPQPALSPKSGGEQKSLQPGQQRPPSQPNNNYTPGGTGIVGGDGSGAY